MIPLTMRTARYKVRILNYFGDTAPAHCGMGGCARSIGTLPVQLGVRIGWVGS